MERKKKKKERLEEIRGINCNGKWEIANGKKIKK